MCLTEPALVVGVSGDEADVVLGGRTRRLSALLVPDLRAGDTVLVGLGTVLARIEPTPADFRRIQPSSRKV